MSEEKAPEMFDNILAIKQAKEEVINNNYSTINKPYVKLYNEEGELINEITSISPYIHSSKLTRGMRRGNEKVELVPYFNGFLPMIKKRVKSQKRKSNFK